jgi:hypothetical protein
MREKKHQPSWIDYNFVDFNKKNHVLHLVCVSRFSFCVVFKSE